MNRILKGLALGLGGLVYVALLSTVAYPAGTATLVQLVLGSTVVSNSNPLPVTGSFSASISGFPTTQTTGTPIAVTTGGVTGTLPTGAVVVASNVGATNGAYCKLGASATTSDQLIPPNSWFAFTVGSNTQLTCITSTSTTTVNMVGGSGLPTGAGGGGGGGGGGGTVTQGPTGTNAAAWWAQIGDTTNGPVAVATAGADAVSNTQSGLASYARNEVYNGTTWDRLRSGSTTGSALINGAGTAGSASGGILTVQGVASMTPLLVNPGTAANWGVVTQGSTTSGQSGNLVQGAVTTSSPTYTTAQTAPISLDTAGNLRVNVVAGGAGGGAVTIASGAVVAGAYSAGSIVDVTTNGATTAHTCSTGGYSVLGCLGQIDDDVKGPIPAGTNLIGKVGIDQTTPGTTNAVSATNFPASVSTGTGAQGASSPRVTVATDSATVAGSTSIPAGTNLMGKVGIDQTTPGTTNAVSLAQIGATTVSTGTGAQGAGSQRVAVATDTATIAGSAPGTAGTASANVVSIQGIASMTKLLVTPDANSAVNLAQVAGTTTSVSTGNSDNGTQRVVLASNQPTVTTATAALDPCQTNVATIKPVTIPTNTTTNILTGTSAKKIYICYWYAQTGLANNYAIISGTTGATCGANTAALVGGTTAATGLLNAANSGQAMGNGGYSVMQTQTNNDDICVITSASGPLSIVMKYVVQ